MDDRLLICTDLDRTLIPNGPQPESPEARKIFSELVSRDVVSLAYVSGRHRQLIEQAIKNFSLPVPDFVIGDVGTTIYSVGPEQSWMRDQSWENRIEADWNGFSHAGLKRLLADITDLRPQEYTRQNQFKLSYYVPLKHDNHSLSKSIHQRFRDEGIHANLIWSTDEPAGVGLLDILPGSASKYHAIEALMEKHHYSYENTVFCGDSGNDLEVVASPVPAVLVANSASDIKELAHSLATEMGHLEQLYIARGGFMDMNGNYSAGMLEGIAYFHPEVQQWISAQTIR